MGDRDIGPNTRTPRTRQLLQQHQMVDCFGFDSDNDPSDHPDLHAPEDHYDIDDHLTSLSINNTRGGPRFGHRPSMPRATWKSLSRQDQVTWDQVSDDGKRAILNALRPVDVPPKSPSKNTSTESIRKQVIHETLVHDTDEFQDAAQSSDDFGNPEASDNRLVNAASGKKSKNLDPTDIRHILSSKHPTPPGPNSKAPTVRFGNVHITVSSDTSDRPSYSISRRTQSSNPGGLVDRGANGGLAGKDLRGI